MTKMHRCHQQLQRSPEAREETKEAKAKVEAKERKEVRVEERERHSKEDAGAVGARTSKQTAP